ncbi:MAG: hypothetical protein AAB289_16600 [Chloroflexota bacterium]
MPSVFQGLLHLSCVLRKVVIDGPVPFNEILVGHQFRMVLIRPSSNRCRNGPLLSNRPDPLSDRLSYEVAPFTGPRKLAHFRRNCAGTITLILTLVVSAPATSSV